MATNGQPKMAGELAIEVHGLEKKYRLGEHASIRKVIQRLSRSGAPAEQFGALSGIEMQVRRGDCLGLVGANGSGKSTLLHVIAGITAPTGGVVRLRGRVLPLFQIGAAFHPDLTGRENIRLYGAILGIPQSEIEEMMDAIAEFAGVERHMDTPNKRYSDGMQARLSCAVAVLFPADIYMFDEVLAVVDGGFRDRCLDEIRRLVGEGRTVIIVSHDLTQIEAVCDRTIWIDSGRIKAGGATADVLPLYREAISAGVTAAHAD